MCLAIEFFLAFLGVGNNAFGSSEDCKITAHFDSFPRKPFGTFLADNYIARNSMLSSEEFNSPHFWVAVADVTGGASGFFMCHV